MNQTAMHSLLQIFTVHKMEKVSPPAASSKICYKVQQDSELIQIKPTVAITDE